MNQPSHVIVPVPGCGEVIFQFTREPGGPAMVTLTGTLRVNRTDLRIVMVPTRWDAPAVDVGLRKVREKKWGDKPSAATQEKAAAIVNQVWAAAHTDPMIDADALADGGAYVAASGSAHDLASNRLADNVVSTLRDVVVSLQARHARALILSGVPASVVDPTPPINADDLLAELRATAEWVTAPPDRQWEVYVHTVGLVRVVAADEGEAAVLARGSLHGAPKVLWARNVDDGDD